MGVNTYEETDKTEKLETYEWDDVWFEQAPDMSLPRALMIGDSISRGCRQKMIVYLKGVGYVDNYATSKALDNPCLKSMISIVLAQQPRCDAIQFNNGLHGWHLEDAEYERQYEDMLLFLQEKIEPEKLVITLTTPVREKGNVLKISVRNQRVIRRNEIVKRLCEKYKLSVNDAYTPLLNRPELYRDDGVHFEEEGYQILTQIFAQKLKQLFN